MVKVRCAVVPVTLPETLPMVGQSGCFAGVIVTIGLEPLSESSLPEEELVCAQLAVTVTGFAGMVKVVEGLPGLARVTPLAIQPVKR